MILVYTPGTIPEVLSSGARCQAVRSIGAGVLSSSQLSGCGCTFPVLRPCESVFANPQMPFLQNSDACDIYTLGAVLAFSKFLCKSGRHLLPVTDRVGLPAAPTGVCMLGSIVTLPSGIIPKCL